MWRIVTISIVAVILALPVGVRAVEESKEPENLEVFADHLKFQNGLEFMKLRMYDKALEAFNEYLEIYYRGNHRHEAHKFIAEIYFGRLEYLKAIRHYRELYEEFSNTESGVEGYFNIGICYNKMGYDKKAAEIFTDIIENHGDSVYARHARLQLDLLDILME